MQEGLKMIKLALIFIIIGEIIFFVKIIYAYSKNLNIEEFISNAPLEEFLNARRHSINAIILFQILTIMSIL